jgi:DNA-binding response OmpR family regulator
MPRILIVEDDPRIVEAVETSLSLCPGFTLDSVADPAKALRAALDLRPDLILLDVRLPGGDGRVLLKSLRENPATRATPVIFLTGLSGEADRVLGLNLGADDYVVKPFCASELLARVHAVLRRTRPSCEDRGPLRLGGLLLDPVERSAALGGRPLDLQPREFEVLFLLASNAGRTLSRRFLIENSSTYLTEVSSRSLDTHVKNLRRKLGRMGGCIETRRKLGYRFSPPDD